VRAASLLRLADVAEGRNNNFNLIRFLSAIGVIVFHSYALSGQIDLDPITRLMGTETSGSIGVRAFFVVSGFLVTRSFLTRGALAPFLVARMLRIYPALIVATVFSIGVAAWCSTVPLTPFLSDPLTSQYLLGNSFAWRAQFLLPGAFTDNPFPQGVNGSLWTIPVEIRLYLLCAGFGVLRLFRNRILFNIALVTLIAVFAWRAELLPIEFRSEIARSLALEFGAGAWAYVHRERIVLSVFAAGAALAIFVWNPGGISSSNLMIPAFVYVLLVLAYHPALRFDAFNRLGDYSYGLYLYAFPIQQTIMFWFRDLGALGLLATSLPATLIVAVLSWHGLEKPALGLKSRASLITRPRQ
jgi:peptidoglycan/LPS O-acetylase OafA/YrhL